MTDWTAVRHADFAVPDDRPLPGLLDELCVMLASPDPTVRDDTAYPVLALWTARGVLDGHLAELGDRMAERLGWLHAAAHGADAVRGFARSPRLRAADLTGLLDLTVGRLLDDAGYLFAHGEDDRIAYALASVLTRAELTAADATAWLDRIGAAVEAGEPGPVPAWASNTLRTLAGLYVFADRGVRWYEPDTGAPGAVVALPHADAVKERLAPVVRKAWRGLG